jgi:GNAT superfamily N-acetyltransferase
MRLAGGYALARRAVGFVRRRGAREALALVLMDARSHVLLRQSHVWFALDLAGRGAAPDLPDGLRLIRAGEAHVDGLDALGSFGPESARARLAEGALLWLVLTDDATPVSAAWSFDGSVPTVAARGGTVALPEGVAALEDVVTAEAHRGRGIGPAAWAQIADRMRRRGARCLVTVVEEANAPSRTAMEKAGFRAFALTEHRRLGPWHTVTVREDGSALAAALRRALPARRGAPLPTDDRRAAPAPVSA